MQPLFEKTHLHLLHVPVVHLPQCSNENLFLPFLNEVNHL